MDRDELILREYIWTREEESGAQTQLVALTSVTVGVLVGLFGLFSFLPGPLRGDGKKSADLVTLCRDRVQRTTSGVTIDSTIEIAKYPNDQLLLTVDCGGVIRRDDTPSMPPWVWLLFPIIPLGMSGWIVLGGFQSALRRRYLELLESELAQLGFRATVDGCRIALPIGARVMESVTRRMPGHQTQKGFIEGRVSRTAVIVAMYGISLVALLNGGFVCIALVSAFRSAPKNAQGLYYSVCGMAALLLVGATAFLLRAFYKLGRGNTTHWGRFLKFAAAIPLPPPTGVVPPNSPPNVP